MNGDITEQYLNQLYDTFQREQLKMMNDIKSGTEDAKTKYLTKQISLINTLNINILRFRNFKKSYEEKINNI